MARDAGRRTRAAERRRRTELSRGKRLAFTLIALLLPLWGLAAVELALRLAGAGYPTSFFIPVPDTDARTTNPRFGWRFFPPALARTPLVAWMPSKKDPAAFRIFVLGESAAMGIPEPAFGFARMLEVMLAEAYPDERVEVVNTAMTAINSHAIRDIARECARYGPELFIIYMGNNEVVGPFGPGTIFTRAGPALPLIRARMAFGRTRTGQVASSMLQRLTGRPPRASRWRGMEMLTEQQLPEDDPRLARTYAQFRRNLESMLDAAESAGAPALVATVATNLRDTPPFGSQHARELTGADADRWNAAVQRGIELQAAGRYREAISTYREALALDAGFAAIQFRLGGALLAEGRVQDATDAFARARDLDVLRFRADGAVNGVIRTVAEDRISAGRRVAIVDAERLFAETSGRPPGDDLFWEHVHLNPAGNYLLARAFFPRVAQILDRSRGRTAAVPSPASIDLVAERLALTDWDRLRMASSIFEMTKRPPFSGQLDHERRTAQRRQDLLALRVAARAEGDGAERAYRRAISHRPLDLHLRVSFAMLLRERGRFAEAADQWRALLARIPGVVEWRSHLAFALADHAASPAEGAASGSRGQTAGAAFAVPNRTQLLAEAESILRGVLDEQPALAAAHANLGTVLERQGRLDAAAEAYGEALRLNPGYEIARLNLAALAAARGEHGKAEQLYREASALDPLSADAHARLAGVLEVQQRPAEAIAEYRRALELDPDLAPARNALAYALERQGHARDAIEEYRLAVASDPDYLLARLNLADLLMREEHLAGAARELEEIRAREPDHPAALIGLALILATAEERRLRNPAEAVRLAERAASVTGGAPEALRSLAMAYAAAGRLDDAVQAATRGAQAARAGSNARLAAMLDDQVRRYREAVRH